MFSAVSRRSRPAALEYVSQATIYFKAAESQSLQLVGASGFGSSLVLRSYEVASQSQEKWEPESDRRADCRYIALFRVRPAALFDMAAGRAQNQCLDYAQTPGSMHAS